MPPVFLCKVGLQSTDITLEDWLGVTAVAASVGNTVEFWVTDGTLAGF